MAVVAFVPFNKLVDQGSNGAFIAGLFGSRTALEGTMCC